MKIIHTGRLSLITDVKDVHNYDDEYVPASTRFSIGTLDLLYENYSKQLGKVSQDSDGESSSKAKKRIMSVQ